MTAPTVSVIMPAYNSERYVEEAVESILNQSFSDFEFIIIDDGSTDTTLARLGRHAERDRRIRLSSRPNTGVAKALNEAASLVRGRYIARMDADDVSAPHRLERQVNYLEQHPECVVVGSAVVLTDPDGWPLRTMGVKQRHEEIDSAHLRGEGGAIVHGAAMFRTDALRAIGGYVLRIDEDQDLLLRLAEHGQVANLPDVLLYYRQHAKSVGHQRYRELVRSVRVAVAEARVRRGLPPLEDSEPLALETSAAPNKTLHKKWAWWALSAGYPKSARKHALLALREAPLSLESWRVAYCALRGR